MYLCGNEIEQVLNIDINLAYIFLLGFIYLSS